MERTSIVIVGAGPSGLALGLSLAQLNVASVLLEKENDITEDPRGVFLAGDSVRILWQLGLGSHVPRIGHEVAQVNFHKTGFNNPPFFQLETGHDALNQTVPDGILQAQPRLERALRDEVAKSQLCKLYCNAKVVDRKEKDAGVVVEYIDSDGVRKTIAGDWLVGADGKKGVVRKHFLEKSVGIRQEAGSYSYEGTWVAANLKIDLPTPHTHPEFPLWKLGFDPDNVYDLFWPKGWHFCSPPGKATACGRFGPHEDRLWRHEFAEPHWDDSMDAVALFWKHITPMITRSLDRSGSHSGNIMYPQDCIKIMRCRPFHFKHQVVNKWYHRRTVLIGDAAHVFPPFGGQGIACGIRDAYGLAWRLALLTRLPRVTQSLIDRTLTVWSHERRQGVDDSAKLTQMNGRMCNEQETWAMFMIRKVITLAQSVPYLAILHPLTSIERNGYRPTKDGFYLSQHGGGGKLAQVYVQELDSHGHVLSDIILLKGTSVLSLLILGDCSINQRQEVGWLMHRSDVHPSILSDDAIVQLTESKRARSCSKEQGSTYHRFCISDICDLAGEKLRRSYEPAAYFKRLNTSTKFVIVRPDFIIVAQAKDLKELQACIDNIKIHLEL